MISQLQALLMIECLLEDKSRIQQLTEHVIVLSLLKLMLHQVD